MSPKDSHSSLPAASPPSEEGTWDRVAEAIDALSNAWETHLAGDGEEPDWAKWVPEGDPGVRALTLPELVKVDLEYRWQRGRSPRKVEAYVEQFPELGSPEVIPVELIHEELQVRMQAGDRVTEEEIQLRFPRQANHAVRVNGWDGCRRHADLHLLCRNAPGNRCQFGRQASGARDAIFLFWGSD